MIDIEECVARCTKDLPNLSNADARKLCEKVAEIHEEYLQKHPIPSLKRMIEAMEKKKEDTIGLRKILSMLEGRKNGAGAD